MTQQQQQQPAVLSGALTAQQLRAALLATGADLRAHTLRSSEHTALTASPEHQAEFWAQCDGLMAALDLLDGAGNLR